MSYYTDGRTVTDAISVWANNEGIGITEACSRMNINAQSFYGWAHDKRVTHRILQRIESVIGPINAPIVHVPEGKLLVDIEKFNQLVDHVLEAHSRRENHIDMAIAVACAKVCLDAILDIQEKEMERE